MSSFNQPTHDPFALGRNRQTSGRSGGGDATPPTNGRVRVILVGRTGQDAALRHDQNVELIRTHHALGAIGELATPMDAESPSATTVLVGPGVVEDERARSFVAALRRVDPDVRVLVVSDRHNPVYDGSVPSDVTPDALRRLVHGPARLEGADDLDEDAGTGPSSGGEIGLADESSGSSGAPLSDEEQVVSALLAGHGPSHDVTSKPLNGRAAGLTPEDSVPDVSDVHNGAGQERLGWSREALTPPPLPGLADGEGRTGLDSDRSGKMPWTTDADSPREHVSSGAAVAPEANAGAGGVLDAGPARAMLVGRSALAEAVRSVREASGLACLRVIPHAGNDAEGLPLVEPPGADTPHIKLIHQGVLLGYVVVDPPTHAGDVKRLTPEQVEYLALWAALDRHEAQLREYAFTDELTGAYNRRFFNRFMATSLEQAKRTRQFLTLLYFDIDDFKLYNDRFGHTAGDEILISVVALLKSVIRPGDKVCRLGGDEFGVIFFDPSAPGAGASGVEEGSAGAEGENAAERSARESRMGGAPQSISQIAQRFQKQICAHRFPKLGEMAPGTLTVSGGMATFPWDGRDADELLSRADELLLQSKAQGKNLITLGPGAEQVCRPGSD